MLAGEAQGAKRARHEAGAYPGSMGLSPGGYLLAFGVALAICACGGDDSSPPPPDPSATGEEQIAATVNAFWTAVVDGDAESACSALTDRGQRLMSKVIAQEWPGVEFPGDCVAAITEYSTQLAADERRDAFPSAKTYAPSDVSIDENGLEAQVRCEFRGAIFMKRTGGEWLIDLAFCVD